MRLRRWIAHRFCTRVTPAMYNRHGGRILTTHEWETSGGFATAMTWGYRVERRDWWRSGSYSAVTAATPDAARARLDAWQDAAAEAKIRSA